MIIIKFTLKGNYNYPLLYKNKKPIEWDKFINKINQTCETAFLDEYYKIIFFSGNEKELQGVWLSNNIGFNKDVVRGRLAKDIEFNNYGKAHELIKYEEITVKRFCNYIEEDFSRNFSFYDSRNTISSVKLDIYEKSGYAIEEVITSKSLLNKKEAIIQADSLMGDESLKDELDRIYNNKNEKGFYGHPVHYRLKVNDFEYGNEVASLLVQALSSKNRIRSRRITWITNLSAFAETRDLEKVFESARGGTLAIDISNLESRFNFAFKQHELAEVVDRIIRKICKDTLVILLEKGEKSAFTKDIVNSMSEYLSWVVIEEGRGGKQVAESFIAKLVSESAVADISFKIGLPKLPAKNIYTPKDIYKAFHKWNENCLKTEVYPAYASVNSTIRIDDTKTECFKEIDGLIGLKEVKESIHKLVAVEKMKMIRSSRGIYSGEVSRHMVFTGNPGTAKTTVARLLGDVLLEKRITNNNNFVECGRADLIDKYVGWTAGRVKNKFSEAKGGILFIDEAYSLVDSTKSFGDEAISTIVQEMENHRDDTVVIFAGYPDKMQEFLDANEGLRSRIAFHLNFPDYNGEELTEILIRMIKEQGLKCNKKALNKSTDYFNGIFNYKDFGNGRFVRNYLERAIMNQSIRIEREYGEKRIPNTALITLLEEDFEPITKENENKALIGF